MKSLIFRAAMKFLFPLLVGVSLVIFWRGHHLPGGGFIGGLVAASSCLLYAMAMGVEQARKLIRFSPITILAMGLFFAATSGFIGWGQSAGTYFVGSWKEFYFVGALGSPVLFDLGVYLVVLGFATHVLFALLEEAL